MTAPPAQPTNSSFDGTLERTADGGQIVFAGRPADGDDEPFTISCTVLRVEAPMLLEHTHIDAGSRVRWELEPTTDGCVLRLSHLVPDTDAAIENCYVVGLHTSLGRLAPLLAGRPIGWDWDAFAEAQAAYAQLGLAAEVSAS